MRLKRGAQGGDYPRRGHYEAKLFKLETDLNIELEKLIKETDISDKCKQIVFTRLAPITEPEAKPYNSFVVLAKKFNVSAGYIQQLMGRTFYAICKAYDLQVKDYI